MFTLLARHKVEDFDKWMALYEAQRGELAALGVTAKLAYEPWPTATTLWSCLSSRVGRPQTAFWRWRSRRICKKC